LLYISTSVDNYHPTAAYGWPADISEEDALARLLALNLDRSR
jgi:hypothetical protein